jgi:hypothetical protein
MTDDELVKLFAKNNCYKYPPSPKTEKLIVSGCLPEVARRLVDGLVDNYEVYIESVLFTKLYNDCIIGVDLPKFVDIKHYKWDTMKNCKVYGTTDSPNSILFNCYVIVCSPTATNVIERYKEFLAMYNDFLEKAKKILV